MKIHLEMADEHEHKAIQSYVDRYKKFFSAIAVAYISTGISFCLAPLLSKQQLPADGWIPFSIEPFGTYCVVYIVQVYCILQTALCIGVDFMIITLFCYPAARLDILSMRMKQVSGQDLLVLCFDMEDFCKRATAAERIVLQRYVDRYKYFHGIYTLWCFLTTVFVISGPLYSPQTFPTHAIYPVLVDYQPLKSLIFFHQSLVGFQASSGMAVDTQIALLLRYAAARFELLAMQLHTAKSGRELNDCIKLHNELLRYTRRLCNCVRFLVLATVTTTTVAMIFGSLNLVAKQPLPLKALYSIVVFSASVELFMYAWPADSLMRMAANISRDVYNADWFEMDIATQKKILFVIMRSQKLETIHVRGIVPKLSLPYYAQYLYTSASYFAALRIVVVGI